MLDRNARLAARRRRVRSVAACRRSLDRRLLPPSLPRPQAKWGEGDARWQVADMGVGGRNVNNWHWTEKDALPWCRERLTGAPCCGSSSASCSMLVHQAC